MIVIEPGIGYPVGHWAKCKIWESYAIYHSFCGIKSSVLVNKTITTL